MAEETTEELVTVVDAELPIRIEVNVVLLVSLTLGLEEVNEDPEASEDAMVLVSVELTLVSGFGVVAVSVVWGLVVVVALPVVVVGSVVGVVGFEGPVPRL